MNSVVPGKSYRVKCGPKYSGRKIKKQRSIKKAAKYYRFVKNYR